MKIIHIKTGFIKKADQVDITGIIQLIRAAFAHGDADHASRCARIITRLSRDFPARNFSAHKTFQRHIDGTVGKV